ncbi:DUF5955 family protein [Streptomyces mayteni]
MAAGETEAASGARRRPTETVPGFVPGPGGWDTAPPGAADPRVGALRVAIERLRRDLNGYPAPLDDREIAERHLALLSAAAGTAAPEAAALRNALLMIAGAVGSVSALAPAVVQLRQAVELFGPPPPVQVDVGRDVPLPRAADWPAGR